MQKMVKLGRAKMIVREEEERKESTEEEVAEGEDSQLGPKSSLSLLDQHSKLKEEARGLYRVVWCKHACILCTHAHAPTHTRSHIFIQ